MSILGAIGGALGGVGNYFATKSANEAAAKEAKKARAHDLNILQNQVGWRVADSIRAGLHPLAALGMSPASGSAGTAQVFGPSTDFAAMGQDLGRAIDSTLDPKDKVTSAAIQLGLEKESLENDYTRTQIASQRMRNIQMAGPGVPGGNGSAVMSEIAIPGTDIKMPVHNPGIADQGGSNYGEPGEWVFGGLAGINDAAKYLQLERMLTPGQLGNDAGATIRKIILDNMSKDGTNTRGPTSGDFN